MSHFGSDNYHADKLRCPKCGKEGCFVWEEVWLRDRPCKELVRIEGGFRERIAAKPPFPVELVCSACGATQPPPMQP